MDINNVEIRNLGCIPERTTITLHKVSVKFPGIKIIELILEEIIGIESGFIHSRNFKFSTSAIMKLKNYGIYKQEIEELLGKCVEEIGVYTCKEGK